MKHNDLTDPDGQARRFGGERRVSGVRKMITENSTVKLLFKDGKALAYKGNIPDFSSEKALPLIEKIVDDLEGQGLCYMHIWTILHTASEIFREKRDRIPL